MTFGERGDGSGGFFISPGAIINVVAASAIGGLALMAIGNNADIGTIKEKVANQADRIARLEATGTALDQTITTILGNQRGLLDAHDAEASEQKRLSEELHELRKEESDFRYQLGPGHPPSGH